MRLALAILLISTVALGLIRLVRWRLGHFDTNKDVLHDLPDAADYVAEVYGDCEKPSPIRRRG